MQEALYYCDSIKNITDILLNNESSIVFLNNHKLIFHQS